MNYEVLISNYLAGPEILRRSISGMSDEQIDASPIPFKWSTREVVLHIADSDLIYADHMKRVIAETPNTSARSIPQHEVDELLVIAAWFRANPDEMNRAKPWRRCEKHNIRVFNHLLIRVQTGETFLRRDLDPIGVPFFGHIFVDPLGHRFFHQFYDLQVIVFR